MPNILKIPIPRLSAFFWYTHQNMSSSTTETIASFEAQHEDMIVCIRTQCVWGSYCNFLDRFDVQLWWITFRWRQKDIDAKWWHSRNRSIRQELHGFLEKWGQDLYSMEKRGQDLQSFVKWGIDMFFYWKDRIKLGQRELWWLNKYYLVKSLDYENYYLVKILDYENIIW